jgi:hypothetical protein
MAEILQRTNDVEHAKSWLVNTRKKTKTHIFDLIISKLNFQVFTSVKYSSIRWSFTSKNR